MALSTTQYGYIIDPMVPFTDEKGKTIKNGFVRVFVAGSSTPVVTYRNFDGAANQELIELDNSGRTKTSVIGSKGLTYKVCVYDQLHSQESPILTVDKVSVIGANITAGTGATVVTGLDGLTKKPDGFVDASIVGTDGYVALDHTLVDDKLDTDAKVTAVENDRYIPLLNDDVNDPDSKMTLGRLWQWVLGKIKSLSTTITAFRSGDVIPVDGPSGTAKMSKDDLLRETSKNTPQSFKNDEDGELLITDEKNNIFAKFKDGTLTTYRGTAPASGKSGDDGELVIVDKYNNILAKFENGTLTTCKGVTPASNKIGDDGELVIVDKYNNILAKFENGTLTTCKGVTPASNKSGDGGELVIVDDNDNILAKFANGGFETYNFTTDTVSNKEEKTFVDFRDEGLTNEFFNVASGTFTSSGMTLPAGWANAILSKKHFSFQDETLSFVVDVSSSNTIIYFGSRETLPIKTGLYGSCFKVDFSTHTIGLLTNNQFESDPSSIAYKFSKNSVDFSSWDKVILTLTRSERIITARLTNYYTSEYVEVASTNTTSVGNVDGELYDSIFLATTITVNVENFSFNIPMHSDVLFIGDSVSDGRTVLIGDSWPRKFGDYLGCRCCYAPRAGGQVGTCVEFLLDWISYIKPKIVICSIGVNGGNTQDGFDSIVSICRQANALLVLNTIYNVASGFSNINETNWNAYNAYILSLKCLHIRFDIATSANKETPVFNALDPSYTLSDTVHPTSAGHQILYERALTDAGQIKNLLI